MDGTEGRVVWVLGDGWYFQGHWTRVACVGSGHPSVPGSCRDTHLSSLRFCQSTPGPPPVTSPTVTFITPEPLSCDLPFCPQQFDTPGEKRRRGYPNSFTLGKHRNTPNHCHIPCPLPLPPLLSRNPSPRTTHWDPSSLGKRLRGPKVNRRSRGESRAYSVFGKQRERSRSWTLVDTCLLTPDLGPIVPTLKTESGKGTTL